MNRKQKMSIAVAGMVCMSLAVTAATANSLLMDTPLYTVRMEQASSNMNFLPTEVNSFTYITGNGYTLNHDVVGSCGATPLWTSPYTECTCVVSCWETCPCNPTCLPTCPETCNQPTCPETCEHTCRYTCEKPCIP